ncbi:class I SAM-dependent methyltransferase, partial [Candidatus Omnitrophota bacterium]
TMGLGGTRWIDICCGTGEMAVNLSRLARRGTHVVAADFSSRMISKAASKPEAERISFVLSDVSSLPFGDGTFDLVTISFATRNINVSREKLLERFREINRILKPDGRFVNLETSQPSSGLLKKLFHFYVRLTVKPLGHVLSGSKAGYAYLSHTIPRFYDSGELAVLLQQAGFVNVVVTRLLFGVGAIHKAVK